MSGACWILELMNVLFFYIGYQFILVQAASVDAKLAIVFTHFVSINPMAYVMPAFKYEI